MTLVGDANDDCPKKFDVIEVSPSENIVVPSGRVPPKL